MLATYTLPTEVPTTSGHPFINRTCAVVRKYTLTIPVEHITHKVFGGGPHNGRDVGQVCYVVGVSVDKVWCHCVTPAGFTCWIPTDCLSVRQTVFL